MAKVKLKPYLQKKLDEIDDREVAAFLNMASEHLTDGWICKIADYILKLQRDLSEKA